MTAQSVYAARIHRILNALAEHRKVLRNPDHEWAKSHERFVAACRIEFSISHRNIPSIVLIAATSITPRVELSLGHLTALYPGLIYFTPPLSGVPIGLSPSLLVRTGEHRFNFALDAGHFDPWEIIREPVSESFGARPVAKQSLERCRWFCRLSGDSREPEFMYGLSPERDKFMESFLAEWLPNDLRYHKSGTS